MIIYNVNKFFS